MRRLARGRVFIIAAATAITLLIGVLVVAMASGVGDPDLGVVAAPFEDAPTFTLPYLSIEDGTVGSERFQLSDVAGQPTFVYFWASWCLPCEQEAPLIERLWDEEFREAGYAFIGINILDSPENAAAFARRHGLTFPLLIDDRGEVYIEYGVNGVPEGFFLRPGLRVDRRFLGELHEPQFRTMLERLIEG